MLASIQPARLVLMIVASLALSGIFGPVFFEQPAPEAYSQVNPPLVCQDATCTGRIFDYLIVTRPVFIEDLTEFIDWKSSLGFRVGLVTVEWLDQNFQGRHLAERMKTGMHFLRKNSGVVYALLVGDTSMPDYDLSLTAVLGSYGLEEPWNVPTGYYRRLASDPPGEVLPSDVYFVEDRNWDPGELGATPIVANETGEGRLDATLFLGRWAVNTPEELDIIVAKTMSVTRTDRALFTVDQSLISPDSGCPADWPPAGNPEAPPPPFRQFFCYLDTMYKARSVFEASAWLTTDYRATDINRRDESAAARSQLLSYQGAVVISYHGGHECLLLDAAGCESPASWSFEHLFSLFEVESCLIATFYFKNSDSLGEILLKRETGPALVTQAPNPYLFLIRLRKGQSVGEALWRSGETYVYWPNPILLLGDPSLPVFVEPPAN